MANPRVEEIPSSPLSVIGEGPYWDVESQSLYYIDIYGTEASLLRYDFAENKVYTATIDNEKVVSFIIPVRGRKGEFAVGLGRRTSVVQWDGKSPKATFVRDVFEVEQDPKYKNNRINDAKADPSGRLYAGTMRLEECGDLFDAFNGSLYKYAPSEQVVKLRDNVRVSNGIAWNEQRNKFYFIDSCDMDVKEFDWDRSTGDLSNYHSEMIRTNALGN